jgi:uncharacterized protein (DUF433 family)
VADHPETGRPWLVGTDLHVDDVVEALGEDGSHARVARKLGLTLHQVRVAEAAAERSAS